MWIHVDISLGRQQLMVKVTCVLYTTVLNTESPNNHVLITPSRNHRAWSTRQTCHRNTTLREHNTTTFLQSQQAYKQAFNVVVQFPARHQLAKPSTAHLSANDPTDAEHLAGPFYCAATAGQQAIWGPTAITKPTLSVT